jgi:hypothetical protein
VGTSDHCIVTKIAGISDLELYGRFELLQFDHFSHREKPRRKGLGRTGLNERTSVEGCELRGCDGGWVDGVQSAPSLLCMESRHSGVHLWRPMSAYIKAPGPGATDRLYRWSGCPAGSGQHTMSPFYPGLV